MVIILTMPTYYFIAIFYLVFVSYIIVMLRIEFAPIQGYTDNAYRCLHNQIFGGIDCYYSPFVRLEKGEIRNKDLRDILPENNVNLNFVPQIIVNGEEEFIILTNNLANLGYKQIDINMGCPFPLQTRKGRGAAMLQNIDKFTAVCNKINEYSEIDFSIKMRLGMESPQEAISLLNIINNVRLHHLTIHPRTANQQYKGKVDFDSFDYLMKNTNHKIIFNGDIQSIDNINHLEHNYPNLYGIMIGRGLLSNPALAIEYKENKILTDYQRLELIVQMHNKIYEYYSSVLQGDNQLLLKMKTFWEYLENQIGKKASKAIKKSGNIEKYNTALRLLNDYDRIKPF